MPAVSVVDATENRTTPLPSTVVPEPRVANKLLAVLEITPSFAITDMAELEGDHGTPADAVPQPLWFERANVSCTRTPEATLTLAFAVAVLPCVSVTVTVAT